MPHPGQRPQFLRQRRRLPGSGQGQTALPLRHRCRRREPGTGLPWGHSTSGGCRRPPAGSGHHTAGRSPEHPYWAGCSGYTNCLPPPPARWLGSGMPHPGSWYTGGPGLAALPSGSSAPPPDYRTGQSPGRRRSGDWRGRFPATRPGWRWRNPGRWQNTHRPAPGPAPPEQSAMGRSSGSAPPAALG